MNRKTKDLILQAALSLFAKDGYEAVSTSRIAGELGMTKSALYKHYKNKQDILDSVVSRMEARDAELAEKENVPCDTIENTPEEYEYVSAQSLCLYSIQMFRYWTEDPFASNFRKMLTLEQYRNDKMAQLMKQYLTSGPVEYLADIFVPLYGMERAEARQKAISLMGRMNLLFNIYDHSEEKNKVIADAKKSIEEEILGNTER